MASNGSIHPTRIFKSPDDLEKAWNEYKDSLIAEAENWKKVQYVGKEGERKADAQKLPLTFDGFSIYCRKHYGNVHQYFEQKDGYYQEFVEICRAIKEEIRNDQITGGLLGFYNPSITQRLNNLTEKTEVVQKTVKVSWKKGKNE